MVAMAPVSARYPTLLTLTTTGYGKRSPTEDYRETRRGAKGVRTIRTGGRNGDVVAVLPTTDGSEVLVTTQRGITIRAPIAGIRVQSRNTLGVRVIRLDEGDEVRDAVVLEPAVDSPPERGGTDPTAGAGATPPAGSSADKEEDDPEPGASDEPDAEEPDDEDDDEEDDAASPPG